MKITAIRGARGFDAAKKVNGASGHLLVDTIGLVLKALVTSADLQEQEGAKTLLHRAKAFFSRITKIWADAGYSGKLVDWSW